MFKKIFEQPVGENGSGEMSEAEGDKLIKEAEEWLQALMTSATRKLNLAYGNKLISEDDEARLFAFLESVNEKIGAADENSENANETLASLKELGNLLKLPEDIKKEGVALVLQKLEGWAKKEEEAKQKLSYDKTAGGKNAKRKRGVGLFRKRIGSGPSQRDYKKSPMPPAL
ncbi:MAG: hypothetical protein Q7K44_00305 [Candidatus Liptonbacteria bacterium]|nr:hypothetical protein [Candidatus Liptonbacteria bacterium]